MAALKDQLRTLPRLEFSEQEARDADEAMRPASRLLIGSDATEYELRRRLRHIRMLHFAGHAVASNSQDGVGFLALFRPQDGTPSDKDDGLLCSFEIPQLALKGCELVTLSACETNRGPEIELEADNSLARDFLVYGSRRVIASQWRVDDKSTAALMQSFYHNLRRDRDVHDPIRFARALQQARQSHRSSSTWNHPYYWAPFVLIGPPGDTFPPPVAVNKTSRYEFDAP
jgi:CHAT domain-containing protein